MKIKVTSDSTCDLSKEMLDDLNVDIVPLYVVKEDSAYKDLLEISPKDIFDYAEATGKMCKTAAVNVADYLEVFQNALKNYDAVIHISLSKEISSSYQNACIAAKNFNNVYVINSSNLSSGSGTIVYRTALLAKEPDANPQKICNEISQLVNRVETSFVINTLEYLRKGGRCSALVELGANLLKIKPCIEVVNGTMDVGKKYRGPFEKCIIQYVENRLKGRTDIEYDTIFITHTGCSKKTLDLVKNTINKYADFNNIIETIAGCTISSHCGPDTLGIIFVTKK